MIYYWRSERYAQIIDRHNDYEYDRRNDNLSDYDSGSDGEGSTGESSDSSLEGRRRFVPTRFSNHGSRVPKKYRTRWRDTV